VGTEKIISNIILFLYFPSVPDATKVLPGLIKVLLDATKIMADASHNKRHPGPDNCHAGLRPGIQTSLSALRYGISETPSGQITRLRGAVWDLMRRFWLKRDALEMDSGSCCACPE